MLACVSPGKSSADHTLNTLRYAELLKDRAGAANVVGKYMKKMPIRHADTQNNFFDSQRKLSDDMDVDGDDSPSGFQDEMVADENLVDEDEGNLLFDDMEEPVEQYESHPRKPLKNIK